MTEHAPPTDVLLIGLGAAGGIAAHVLTQAGLEVVALEAGPRLQASMMTLDEVRNDLRSWLSSPKVAHEIPTWRSDPSEQARPSPWPMLMVNAVGGTTVHYDCASLRFQPWHFAARTQTIERYGDGAIPAGSTLADWPLSYERARALLRRRRVRDRRLRRRRQPAGNAQPEGQRLRGPAPP